MPGMPPGIRFIVGNEAAERFCFYGLQSILVIYLTQYLRDGMGAKAPMTENDANQCYHWFVAAVYFFPTVGAALADFGWGKYRTVFYLSLVYVAGCLVLAADPTRPGLFAGLALIAVGSGGIKACVSAHVGDQFGAANEHLIERAFGWFYMAINSVTVLATFFIPVVLARYGPHWAFGWPALLMLIATGIFWSGRHRFVHIPAMGWGGLRTAFNRNGLTIIGRLSLIFGFIAVYYSLSDQGGSEWVLQARRMNLHFLGLTWLPPQLGALFPVMMLACIPLCQYGVYPLVNRVFPLTSLRKIGLGLFVSGLSFLVTAWIESKLGRGLKPSIGWQLPAYALQAIAHVMVGIPALEFAYTQAPKTLKSTVMALFFLSATVGNAFTALVHGFAANPNGSLKFQGATYYEFFALLSTGCVIPFIAVAKAYKVRIVTRSEPWPHSFGEAAKEA
jgi:POT family proton-dependent oligopeptide transporter